MGSGGHSGQEMSPAGLANELYEACHWSEEREASRADEEEKERESSLLSTFPSSAGLWIMGARPRTAHLAALVHGRRCCTSSEGRPPSPCPTYLSRAHRRSSFLGAR